MKVRDDMLNGHGSVHGGTVFSLADSAFGYACNAEGPVTVLHSAEIRYLPTGAARRHARGPRHAAQP